MIAASLAAMLLASSRPKFGRLVAEWPEESDVPPLVYRFLPANDETVAEIYQKMRDTRVETLDSTWCGRM